jgi:hypothetical protein
VTVSGAGISHIFALDGQRDQPVTRGSPFYFRRENIITGKPLPIFAFFYEKLSYKFKKNIYAYAIRDFRTLTFSTRSDVTKV